MNFLKTTLVSFTVALVLVLILSGCSASDDFNAWMGGCLAEGGTVSLVHKGEWSDRYECFRDDQIIQVPGFDEED
jgi:uncharacterized lipoprotein YehR (DUF1307 family)